MISQLQDWFLAGETTDLLVQEFHQMIMGPVKKSISLVENWNTNLGCCRKDIQANMFEHN